MKLATYHSTGMVVFQLTHAVYLVFGVFFILIFTLIELLPDDASALILGQRGKIPQCDDFSVVRHAHSMLIPHLSYIISSTNKYCKALSDCWHVKKQHH